MPGGILQLKDDKTVDDIPSRNRMSATWTIANAGQGILVKNAFKDFPEVGQGDPTVDTPGSYAYYKWVGNGFLKLSEGEGLDFSPLYVGASPSTIPLGGLPAGTNLVGRTISSLIEQAIVVYQPPSFSAFAITGQATTVEIGTTIILGNKTFTWNSTNQENIKPPKLVTIRNQSAGMDLANGLANDGNQVVNLPANILLNAEGATQIFRILSENTLDEIFQRDFTITADYLRFFGSPAVAPNNSAGIRALAGNSFGNAVSIVIPQGNVVAAFAYEATRPDITDASVKYVEGFNANVGNTFVKTVLNVLDAGGTPRSYKLFVATLGAPYLTNATYNVTIP